MTPPLPATSIERFAAAYHPYHGISPARAREQVNVLRDFEVFAGVPIEQATDGHLRSYLAKLVADGLHPNTVRKKHSMIQPFFGWCFDNNIVSADTLMRVQRVKNPRGATAQSTPKPYKRKEIEQFWKDLDESWPINEMFLNRWRKGRSRWHRAWKTMMHAQIDAIAKLALHAGLRRDEIFNAPIEDIHYDNEYVVVRYAAAKNKDAVVKPREVPMTQGLASALHRWFEFRTEIDPGHDFPWLSLTAFGPRGADFHKLAMSHDRFSELLGTVGGGYELHRMRHTCATEWLRSGMPLEHLRDLLGHAKIAQTLAYAQIDKTDLTKSMSRSAVDFETAVGRAA